MSILGDAIRTLGRGDAYLSIARAMDRRQGRWYDGILDQHPLAAAFERTGSRLRVLALRDLSADYYLLLPAECRARAERIADDVESGQALRLALELWDERREFLPKHEAAQVAAYGGAEVVPFPADRDARTESAL